MSKKKNKKKKRKPCQQLSIPGLVRGPRRETSAAPASIARPKQTYYFAYGSNMDPQQMAARCPSSVPVGLGSMHGWRLAFAGVSASRGAGVASVFPQRAAMVPGMVYRVSLADLRKLDGYEGAPRFYTRERWPIHLEDGRRVLAHVYILDRRENLPTQNYANIIADAYADHGLDLAPIIGAIELAADATEGRAA